MITGNWDFDMRFPIFLSCFNPVTSLMASIPYLMVSLATVDLGVSIEMGRLQLLLIASIAGFSLLISSSKGIIVSRYGAVDIAPISIISAPLSCIWVAVIETSRMLVLIEFL